MVQTNTKQKRITSIFALLVFLFLFLTNSLYPVFADEEAPEEVDERPTIGFIEESASVIADSDNIVSFTIEMSREMEEDITVYFHTENRSAIAGQDYVEVNSSVVIPSGEIHAKIAVNVSTTAKWATVAEDETYYGPHFIVHLDRVLYEKAIIDDTKNVATGFLRAQYTMEMRTKNKYAYLYEYANIQTATHKNISDIDGGETWKSWEHGVTLNNLTTQSWLSQYVKTGLAKPYVTMLVEQFSYDDWYNSDDPEIWLGNQYMFTSGVVSKSLHNVSDPESYGAMAFWEIDPCNSKWKNGPADELNGYANVSFADGKNPHDDDDDYWKKERYWGMKDKKKVYFYNDKDAWFASKGKLYYSEFYHVEEYNGALDVGASFHNFADWQDYRLYGLTFKMLLLDETAPTVVSSYLDSSSLITSGSLRLIIKFSEPVYVTTNNASVEVKFNTSVTKHSFRYAGGNYSDTLYFELSNAPKRTYTAYSFKVESSLTESINDMAYLVNFGGGEENNTAIDYTSDLIDIEPIIYDAPTLSMKADNKNWAKYHEVEVSTGKVEKGMLYYLWDDEISDVKNVVDYGANRIDFTQSITTISLSGANGKKYLHVMVVTPYGLSTVGTLDTLMLFDNTAPTISEDLSVDELKMKRFDLSFYDMAGEISHSDGIKTLTLKLKKGNEEESVLLFDNETGYKSPAMKLSGEGNYEAVYYLSILDLNAEGNPVGEEEVKFQADPTLLKWMENSDRESFTMYFSLTDVCGNITNTEEREVTFDKRAEFTPKINVGPDLVPNSDLEGVAPLYNLGQGDSIFFNIDTTEVNGKICLYVERGNDNNFEGILFNGEQIGNDGFVIATDEMPNAISLEGLTTGYYRITPYFLLDDGEEEYLVAKTYIFYITANYSEITGNYEKINQGELVLRNNFYELEMPFYYLGALGSSVLTHNYGATWDEDKGRYVGGAAAPAFSDRSMLRDYVTYMEYQDMFLVRLDVSRANFLNAGSGSTIFVKADGETAFAEEGQWWIRYKHASWTPDSTSFGWGFYYYADDCDGTIDIGSLSNNLRNALNRVRDTITKNAQMSYLVGEGGRYTSTGAPRLDEARMHHKYEETKTSHAGTTFYSAISFAGDSAIYDNLVTETDGVTRPLATNLKLSIKKSTKLFYHYGISVPGERWIPLNAKDGAYLARAMSASSGIYTILEVDENGACKFEVCIDTAPPRLMVKINDKETPVDQTTMQLSGNSITLVKMMGEIDPFAYVAVFNSMGKLLDVYYAKDLGDVTLTDSNYQFEIGDRSGNYYLFNIKLVSDGLSVKVELTESKSGVSVVVADRTAAEIYRYEVTCNNVIIANKFIEKKVYTVPGIYTVYVKDIYGNEYNSPPVTYNRAAPELSWFYLNESGTYSSYNPDRIVSMFVSDDKSNYGLHYVSTSTLLRFRMSDTYGDCKFEFTGLSDDDYIVDGGRTVTIQKLSGWSLKVWYDKYPDCYETYVCVLDDIAPSIHVEYIGSLYTYNEQELMRGDEEHQKPPLEIPPTLSYSESDSTILTASKEGAVISSRYITISAEDNFGVRSIAIKCNGKTVTTEPVDGVYTLSEYGTYVITATDLFGNISTYSFTNTADPIATFSIDGKAPQKGDLTTFLKGNKDLAIYMTRDGEAEMLITKDGQTSYLRYRVQNGSIYVGRYVIVVAEEGKDVIISYDSKPIAVLASGGANAGKEFVLYEGDGYTVRGMFNADRTVNFRISCEEGLVTMEARVNCGSGFRPDYCQASICKVGQDIQILSGDGEDKKVVITNQDGDIIYVSEQISIPTIVNDKILYVEEAYSSDLEFKEFVTIFKDGNMVESPIDHSQKGFYCIRIVDIYGNVVEYQLCYSDLATILIYATYVDGSESKYDNMYKGEVIRSNKTVRVEVFGKYVTFTVNGEATTGMELKDRTVLTFEQPGTYELHIFDVTGTENEFHIEIGNDAEFKADKDWITGYNPDSILAEEIYTNQRLNITSGINGVHKIVIRKGDVERVIYNILAQNTVQDETLFQACIGQDGNGLYEVLFYNQYGDVEIIKVHYRETSPLILTRITSYAGVEEEYSIELALALGFFSSHSLTFSTLAEKYVFTVNGETIDLGQPKTYEFQSTSGNGSFEYAITYTDIYGFSYEFNAILLMQNVEIGTDSMTLIDINGKYYTRGNVVVTFGENCTAFVTYGESKPEFYTSGTILRRDGSYRFTVIDIAGNVSTFQVVRDSIANYVFYPASKDVAIHSGYAINDSQVVFRPNINDTVFITGVFLNGKEMKDYDSKTFSDTGLWEILLNDEVGNVSYFSFYLINHALRSFEYNAPKDYTISEVWWSDKDGNRHLTAQKGESIYLNDDGFYAVIMQSTITNMAVNFTLTIDTVPPAVTLVGCEENEETSRDIQLQGLEAGDTIMVYVDDVLVSTIVVESKSDFPTFSEPGKYHVVVRNLAGSEVEFNFTHKYVANGPTNALIIIACLAAVVAIFIGLLLRNRSKYDD